MEEVGLTGDYGGAASLPDSGAVEPTPGETLGARPRSAMWKGAARVLGPAKKRSSPEPFDRDS
jgi:hypothetical protein